MTLSQLTACFGTGYTNEEFGSMADSNQEVLDKWRKKKRTHSQSSTKASPR